MQPEDAVFTVTASELITTMTAVNSGLIIVIILLGIFAYMRVNSRITRLNKRVTDAQTQIADRGFLLAQSLSELANNLAHTQSAGSRKTSESTVTKPDQKDDVVVPLSSNNNTHRA